jgi:hypothetical protein
LGDLANDGAESGYSREAVLEFAGCSDVETAEDQRRIISGLKGLGNPPDILV